MQKAPSVGAALTLSTPLPVPTSDGVGPVSGRSTARAGGSQPQQQQQSAELRCAALDAQLAAARRAQHTAEERVRSLAYATRRGAPPFLLAPLAMFLALCIQIKRCVLRLLSKRVRCLHPCITRRMRSRPTSRRCARRASRARGRCATRRAAPRSRPASRPPRPPRRASRRRPRQTRFARSWWRRAARRAPVCSSSDASSRPPQPQLPGLQAMRRSQRGCCSRVAEGFRSGSNSRSNTALLLQPQDKGRRARARLRWVISSQASRHGRRAGAQNGLRHRQRRGAAAAPLLRRLSRPPRPQRRAPHPSSPRSCSSSGRPPPTSARGMSWPS